MKILSYVRFPSCLAIALWSVGEMALAQGQFPEPFAYPTNNQTQEQQRLQTYYRAWTACMQGRGYSVN